MPILSRGRSGDEDHALRQLEFREALRERGAAKEASPRLSAQLEAVLGVLAVLPLEAPADTIYGSLRTRLERAGRPIGGNDLLIAAHATALGRTLITDNQREFARIPNLPLENWLAQPR